MSLTLIAAAALAQGQVGPLPQPTARTMIRRAAPHQIKNGGTYSVVTGTWTRGDVPAGGRARAAASAPPGQEVVFSNTSTGPNLWTVGIGSLQLPGQITYDEGVLPTPSNFTPGLGTQPDRGIYEITGFEIRYCDFQTPPMSSSWTYSFYESFDPLTDPAGTSVPPAAIIPLTGLPSNGCWTVTIDLTGGAEFLMRGDGAPITPDWQNDPALDSFAYGIEYTAPLGGPAAGVFFAGDPEFTGGTGGEGAGTYYLDPTEQGTACGTTGLGALDGFTLTQGPRTVRTPPNYINGVGCGQGASPFGSTYLRLFASGGPGSSVGSSYCNAVANSSGSVARMSAIGSTIAAVDKLVLECTGLPVNSFGFFLTSRAPGFSINPAGSQGNLCLGGVIGRIDELPQVKNSGPTGRVSLSTTQGEWSLVEQPLGNSVVPALAGERWHYTYWYRDVVGGLPASNFADGLFIDFN